MLCVYKKLLKRRQTEYDEWFNESDDVVSTRIDNVSTPVKLRGKIHA